jgi:CheY-like chemotaxis protein/HPt (histidine-containing phosphotransfer) domain-containing protein
VDTTLQDLDWTVVAQVAQRCPQGPVPLLPLFPALEPPDSAAQLAALGIRTHLHKPVSPCQLLEGLRAVLTPEEATAAPAAVPAPPRVGLRLLLVDDNPVNQMVARGLLERQGHRIEVADSGPQALERWGRDAYDAVLMDLQMPGMDGLEATAAIRSLEKGSSRRTPIIGLSAHEAGTERQRCLDAGMDEYLTKPLQTERLAVALARLVAAPPPEEDLPVLDPAVLRDLAQLEQGGGFSVRDFVEVFLQETGERLRALAEGVTAGDGERVRREAHTVKGSARQIGARRLAAACEALERAASTATAEDNNRLLDRVREEFARVDRALAEYRDGAGPEVRTPSGGGAAAP